MGLRDFTKSVASFSLAVPVLGGSQVGKLLRGIPTGDPTQESTESLTASTTCLKGQFGSIGNVVFGVGETLQNVVIDLTFNALDPRIVMQTNENLLKWGIGVTAQVFFPNSEIATGGPPTGWGNVDIHDVD
jgi:hypothetical protein